MRRVRSQPQHLVEAPDQLLEDRAHTVVVEAWMPDRAVGVHHRIRAQVDVGRGELLYQRAEGVGLGEARDLVAELEVFEDVLDGWREPIEVVREVGLEPLSAGPGPEVLRANFEVLWKAWLAASPSAAFWSTTPMASSEAFMSRTDCFVVSRTASRRRSTVMGRMTSRYVPRT